MPSLFCRALALKLRGTKKAFSSAESTNRLVGELSIRPAPLGPPKALRRSPRFSPTLLPT